MLVHQLSLMDERNQLSEFGIQQKTFKTNISSPQTSASSVEPGGRGRDGGLRFKLSPKHAYNRQHHES